MPLPGEIADAGGRLVDLGAVLGGLWNGKQNVQTGTLNAQGLHKHTCTI